MNPTALPSVAGALALALSAYPSPAQGLQFRMDAAAPIATTGASVTWDVLGVPYSVHAVLVDFDGGPRDLLGERFYLGFGGGLRTLQAGLLPANGWINGAFSVPNDPSLAGIPVFAQAVNLGSFARNGIFRVSGGESSVLFTSATAIVDRFDDPAREGYSGTYASNVRGRLAGGPVRRRTHSTVDPQGVLFPQPVAGPLSHYGSRAQMVYRAQDVGATGEPELLTAVRWRPVGPAVGETYDSFEILAAHTDVTPDYSIGPWTALPVFPASGLDPVFARNYRAGESPLQLFAGRYDVDPVRLRGDGYLDYPAPLGRFRYDGRSSLLLEFRLRPDPARGQVQTGQAVYLMITSSPRPDARLVAAGQSPSQLVDPSLVQSGRGDNAMADYQLEFARVETVALSPWRTTSTASPDYDAPTLAATMPAGTALAVEYRGAANPSGALATPWSLDVNGADGMPFLQYRVTFVGNPFTGEVPSVDTLVVPVN